jgi:hypothetical protein
MPNSLGEVAIINNALTYLGARRITSRDEDNERARVMDNLFDSTRDELFRKSRWNFAIKRASINATSNTPEYEFAYEYELPTDFMYMLETEGNSPYRLEDGKLLSDTGSTLKIKYCYKVTDTSQWDTMFAKILALMLAVEAGARITEDSRLISLLSNQLRVSFIEASKRNGMEDDPQEVSLDSWEAARL